MNPVFFFQDFLIKSHQTDQPNVTIDGLSPCMSYWSVVTAEMVGCDNPLSTQPQAIDLFQSSRFEFALASEDTSPCREWIAEDFTGKVADIENALISELAASCGMSVPCMANSQFTCQGRDIYYE